MAIRVVHCKRESYTHYIGRGSVCGNPFTHLPLASTKASVQVASVELSVSAFGAWARHEEYCTLQQAVRREMLAFIRRLPGDAILGCWCGDGRPCHGIEMIKLREDMLAGRDYR